IRKRQYSPEISNQEDDHLSFSSIFKSIKRSSPMNKNSLKSIKKRSPIDNVFKKPIAFQPQKLKPIKSNNRISKHNELEYIKNSGGGHSSFNSEVSQQSIEVTDSISQVKSNLIENTETKQRMSKVFTY